MAANYPDWAQTWADFYHTTPQQIMANAGASNPYNGQFSEDAQMASRQWESMHPGFDINPATGRRSIDEFINPTGNAASDIGMQWVPGPNTGPQNFMERLVAYGAPAALGAMAGYGALGAAGLLGSELGGAGASGITTIPGATLDTVPFTTLPGAVTDATLAAGSALPAAGGSAANSLWPGLTQSTPSYTDLLAGAPSTVSGTVSNPAWTFGTNAATSGGSFWDQLTKLLTPSNAGKAISATGALANAANGGQQSSTGSLLGGLLGAGLGYLDARNQPSDITVTNKIDPRLGNLAYGADGTGGVGGAAYGLMQQQLGQPNPLTQAGQQISGMAALPGWGSLVDTSKSQWDANPWIKDQQNAITNQVTRNFKENVVPAIGGSAVQAGGYGGSRQGIAEGLAASRMNQDLAPALSTLASDAWNSSQNRALAGAQGAANYGLNNQRQQADIWNLGANLQANGPWSSINNMSSILGRLPGNMSTSTPLFTNIGSNVLGGAQLGSGVGGSVNWDELLKNIGGLLGGVGGWFNNKP